jgi:YegS/Rv2252/BmrU family lipid kinase
MMSVENRPFIVVNPSSAAGRVSRDWPSIEKTLKKHLGGFEFQFTKGPDDALEITRNALKAGHRKIASLGGDGTHGMVVNGLFEQGSLIAEDVVYSVLPFGTGGDLRRTLVVGKDSLSSYVRSMAEGYADRVNVGQVQFSGNNGEMGRRYFINIASFGLSAMVNRSVNRHSKLLGGNASYLSGALRTVFRYRPESIKVIVDGKEQFQGKALIVAICNGRYFGSGTCIAPNAQLEDGLFDVIVVPWWGRVKTARLGLALYRGNHLNIPGVKQFRGRSVQAETSGQCYLEADGEDLGYLPAAFELVPQTLLMTGITSKR